MIDAYVSPFYSKDENKTGFASVKNVSPNLSLRMKGKENGG